jgi:hypothetical protein
MFSGELAHFGLRDAAFPQCLQLLISPAYQITINLKLATYTVHKNEGICVVQVPFASMWSSISMICDLLNLCLMFMVHVSH